LKLVLISDTHGLHDKLVLPPGDILVHAGDLTNMGKIHEIKAAAMWLRGQLQDFKYVVCVGGNHDFGLEAFYKEGREDILRKDFFGDVHYLRDNAVILDGVKFWGSPWQPEFFDWAFNLRRGEQLKARWDRIPHQTDVLITHGPSMGVLDQVGHEHVGCADLRQAVERIKPRVHVFGHIHCGYGQVCYLDGRTAVNAAVCDEAYNVVNAPVEVEI
jgi:Icc-related predicted phosphoesterase